MWYYIGMTILGLLILAAFIFVIKIGIALVMLYKYTEIMMRENDERR